MKVGLVARADDRGIGTMTHEFYNAMRPDRTLVVREPGAERRGFAAHVERYPDAPVVVFDPMRGELPERCVREFLDGLDVVYLVETPYDFRFFEWARDAGCATVLHVMPEFWRWHHGEYERPDVWWLPTSWRADLLPSECRIVEVPVPTRPLMAPSVPTERTTFVHVAGHRAVGDRNGTLLMLQALRQVNAPCRMRMVTQDDRLPKPRTKSNVELLAVVGGVESRWSLFDDADVLVLPRRYGGLCLPVLEAMASGLGIVMSGCAPQMQAWPVMGVGVQRGRSIEMPCGPIVLQDASPRLLAIALDKLTQDRDLVDTLQGCSRDFARAHSWTSLRGLYVDELERACA